MGLTEYYHCRRRCVWVPHHHHHRRQRQRQWPRRFDRCAPNSSTSRERTPRLTACVFARSQAHGQPSAASVPSAPSKPRSTASRVVEPTTPGFSTSRKRTVRGVMKDDADRFEAAADAIASASMVGAAPDRVVAAIAVAASAVIAGTPPHTPVPTFPLAVTVSATASTNSVTPSAPDTAATATSGASSPVTTEGQQRSAALRSVSRTLSYARVASGDAADDDVDTDTLTLQQTVKSHASEPPIIDSQDKRPRLAQAAATAAAAAAVSSSSSGISDGVDLDVSRDDEDMGESPATLTRQSSSTSSSVSASVWHKRGQVAVASLDHLLTSAFENRVDNEDEDDDDDDDGSGIDRADEDGDAAERPAPQPLTDDRVEKRQHQIDIGKATAGYANYTRLVPRTARNPTRADHPMTPDVRLAFSKRHWDSYVRRWRRALHQWDERTEDPTPAPPVRTAKSRKALAVGARGRRAKNAQSR